MFDPSAKPEPWWPLEWHENHSSGYPEAQPYFHPVVQTIQHNIGANEWYFETRSTKWTPRNYKAAGDPVEDEIALRCILLELAYPGGSDG